MVAVSGALIFAGYQMLVYGWSQVTGSNAGFFQILWPGRYTNVAAPDGKGSSVGSTSGSTALGSSPASTSATMPGGSTGATTILGK